MVINGFNDLIPVGYYRKLIRVVYFAGFVHKLRVNNIIAHRIIYAMLFTINLSAIHERIQYGYLT